MLTANLFKNGELSITIIAWMAEKSDRKMCWQAWQWFPRITCKEKQKQRRRTSVRKS